jgi:PAS domain S-box-containing protein
MTVQHPLRIVSVEDDPNDTELIKELFETEDISSEITRVDTQAEFQASLDQGGIDLILADYTLPSFDGLSALKLAMKACPDVPFIFVSGTLGVEVFVEALRLGATDYVLKTGLSRLIPSVRRALRDAREREERKQAEERLRRSEAYLAEAQKLSRTGSFGWNVSSGEIYWSRETFRIFEYEPTIKVTLQHIIQRTHPEDRSAVQQLIEQRSEFTLEQRLLMPDGSVKYVRVVGQPSQDERGRFEFVGAVTDITERKRAEEDRERLRQVEADLAHVNRVSMMGELAASLSHELKQPLAASITNSKTSLRWLAHDQPNLEEVREAIARSVKDTTRACEIIDRLRSLYRKDSRPERELVDVNEIIDQMLVLLRSEATRYSIPMHTDLAEELPIVAADRVQLQQVLMNLMLNGIEAMKETGGELAIASQLDHDGQLLISVSDTGVGLPTEKCEEIFNAFFTTKPQGSGMGLTISRSIVGSHGGRLWATSNFGRGATFHFTLPTAGHVAKAPATGT